MAGAHSPEPSSSPLCPSQHLGGTALVHQLLLLHQPPNPRPQPNLADRQTGSCRSFFLPSQVRSPHPRVNDTKNRQFLGLAYTDKATVCLTEVPLVKGKGKRLPLTLRGGRARLSDTSCGDCQPRQGVLLTFSTKWLQSIFTNGKRLRLKSRIVQR